MLNRYRTLFYGWVVIVALAVISCFSMAFATLNFGLFIRPMGDQLGITRTSFGWAMSARMGVGALTSPMIGRIIDRYGSRYIILFATMITGSAVACLGLITQGWQLIALFGFMGIIAMVGPANLAISVPVAKWFIKKKGIALAIVGATSALGGVIFVPLSQTFIHLYGWRTSWFMLALIGSSVIIPVSFIFVRRQPEDFGLYPDGESPSGEIIDSIDDESLKSNEPFWTVREVIVTVKFWLLAILFGSVMLSLSTIGIHRIPNFIDQGLDPTTVAFATSLDPLAFGISTFLFGFLVQKIPIRFIGGIGMIGLSAAIYLSIIGNTSLLMCLSFIIFGLAMGAIMMMNNYIWPDYYGRKFLGSIRGIVTPITLLGSGAGAPLAGYIKDVTGSYDSIWLFMIVVLIIDAFVIVFVKPPHKNDIFSLF